MWHMYKCVSSEETVWGKHVAWHNIISISVASGIFTVELVSPPQDLFSRRNLEVLGTFALPSSPSVDLELIEEPEDAGLTDRPLRLAASLFWFVCAVLLLVRGSLWARFPRVSSSTSSVVFLHSETGKALDSALASTGGRGGRGRRSCLDVCVEHSVEWACVVAGGLPRHVLLALCGWGSSPSSLDSHLLLLLVSWLISYWQKTTEAPFGLTLSGGLCCSWVRPCCRVVTVGATASFKALRQGTLWSASGRAFCPELDPVSFGLDSDSPSLSSSRWFLGKGLWSICCSPVLEPQSSRWTLACLALKKVKRMRGYERILECPLWLPGLESSALDHTYIFWSTVFFVFVGLFKGSWVSPTLEKYSDLLCSLGSV